MKIGNLDKTMYDYVAEEDMWFRFTTPEQKKQMKKDGRTVKPNELWTVKKAILVLCSTLVEESEEEKMDIERSLTLDNICQRCHRAEGNEFEVSADDISLIRERMGYFPQIHHLVKAAVERELRAASISGE